MTITILLGIVSFLAGGCAGERNRFKAPATKVGLIVGGVVGGINVLSQIVTNPGYLSGNLILSGVLTVISFVVFGLAASISWFVAKTTDEEIFGT